MGSERPTCKLRQVHGEEVASCRGDAVFQASDVAAWTIDELHKIHFGFERADDKFPVDDSLAFQKLALAVSVVQHVGSRAQRKREPMQA